MRARHLMAAVLASCFIFAADDGLAQEEEPVSLEALDVAVSEVLSGAGIPGAALIAIEDKRIVFSKNYGVADLSTQTPVVDTTVFRAGSISKSFTAIGVMMLTEEGRIGLDADLSTILDDFSLRSDASSAIAIVSVTSCARIVVQSFQAMM